MNGEELARRINNRLCAGVKTPADEQECLALGEELRNFVREADAKDVRKLDRMCIGLEAFVKIVLGLEYDKAKSGYAKQKD